MKKEIYAWLLSEVKNPVAYHYLNLEAFHSEQHVLEKIRILEQRLLELEALGNSLNSYLCCVTQVKIDLLYQKLFVFRSQNLD